jgi:hypothetical protein
MDNGSVIKPRAGAHRSYALRDPVPVRETAETELDPTRAVSPAGQESGGNADRHGRNRHNDSRPDHAAPEVVVDPLTLERIYRERDVRAPGRDNPDQAMLRQRAYGRPALAGDAKADTEPHADIEA